MSNDRYQETLDALAHEIWAVAQLAPGEGIADGAARVEALLREALAALKAENEALRAERDALAKDAARYAIARRMSPQQWASAWELNHRTGKPFDEIIYDLAPFFGAALAKGEQQ
jgi:hypothetical protein